MAARPLREWVRDKPVRWAIIATGSALLVLGAVLSFRGSGLATIAVVAGVLINTWALTLFPPRD